MLILFYLHLLHFKYLINYSFGYILDDPIRRVDNLKVDFL